MLNIPGSAGVSNKIRSGTSHEQCDEFVHTIIKDTQPFNMEVLSR